MTRSLSILVVDDDDLVLESVVWLLESLGHRIEAAPSGREALARLQGGLAVDLLMVDQNMPGLSGLETLAAVRAFRPELPVFLATGYRDSDLEATLATFPRTRMVHKPFRAAELQAILAGLEEPAR